MIACLRFAGSRRYRAVDRLLTFCRGEILLMFCCKYVIDGEGGVCEVTVVCVEHWSLHGLLFVTMMCLAISFIPFSLLYILRMCRKSENGSKPTYMQKVQ